MHVCGTLAVALLCAACHKSPKAAVFVETRVETGGEGLLELLPPGADAVAELDVARLRGNEVVGKLVALAAPRLRAGEGLLPVDPLIDADMVVAAVYDLAGDTAATVVIVRGAAVDAARVVAADPQAAQVVDPHTFVFAVPELRGEVVLRAEPAEESVTSMSDDKGFMRLRAQAMPLRAPGASLRLTARLDPQARKAGAARLGLAELPATVSVWGDVADDLAVVAEIEADDGPGARRTKAALDKGQRLVHLTGIDVPLDKLTIDVIESRVRLVWTVGPHALEDWVDRLSTEPEAPATDVSHE
jgi:hypothetical protein